MRDEIFSQKIEKLESFKFDAKVADVFADMILRSVPIYGRILQLLPLFLDKYLAEKKAGLNSSKQTNANKKPLALSCEKLTIYDLGASLGATSFALANYLNVFFKDLEADFFLVDNSAAMLNKAEQNLTDLGKNIAFNFLVEDIKNTKINNADFVILNFTLQFLSLADRNSLVEKVYRGLKKGAYFILSEKIHFDDQAQNFLQDMHWRFKAFNGYSQTEISQKRRALEDVLITETLEEHQARLKLAGFSKVFLWQQEFNFVSLVAIK